jgi:hypothetical protein
MLMIFHVHKSLPFEHSNSPEISRFNLDGYDIYVNKEILFFLRCTRYCRVNTIGNHTPCVPIGPTSSLAATQCYHWQTVPCGSDTVLLLAKLLVSSAQCYNGRYFFLFLNTSFFYNILP